LSLWSVDRRHQRRRVTLPQPTTKRPGRRQPDLGHFTRPDGQGVGCSPQPEGLNHRAGLPVREDSPVIPRLRILAQAGTTLAQESRIKPNQLDLYDYEKRLLELSPIVHLNRGRLARDPGGQESPRG
jgi:hypothetical protein